MKQTFSNLIDYIKAWEVFIPVPYYATEDEKARGIMTIGYGQTYSESACPTAVTEDEATGYLEQDLDQLLVQLQPLIGSVLSPYNEDGITSMAYNMGLENCPHLINACQNKDYDQAYLEFFNGIYQAGTPLLGLIRRRACDSAIFKYGRYEKRDYLTPEEKQCFIKMNAGNTDAIAMIMQIKICDE